MPKLETNKEAIVQMFKQGYLSDDFLAKSKALKEARQAIELKEIQTKKKPRTRKAIASKTLVDKSRRV